MFPFYRTIYERVERHGEFSKTSKQISGLRNILLCCYLEMIVCKWSFEICVFWVWINGHVTSAYL